MATVEINPDAKFRVDDILKGVSKLETPDLENFLQEVAHLLAKRKAKLLSKKETELHSKIGESILSQDSQRRYNSLYKKLHDETISPDEHSELLALIDVVEKRGVERLQCLIELSQLQQISLDKLMEQLGLKPYPAHA